MFVFITLIVTIAICNIVHLMGLATAGWFVGSLPESITLFYGPRLKQFTMDDVVFNIGSIPLGGSVKFKNDFQSLHYAKSIFVASFGCFVLIVISVLFFGMSEGIHLFTSGFKQLISGASSPRLQGSKYWISLFTFVENNSFTSCLALVAAKMNFPGSGL